jgi:hypothetical protein
MKMMMMIINKVSLLFASTKLGKPMNGWENHMTRGCGLNSTGTGSRPVAVSCELGSTVMNLTFLYDGVSKSFRTGRLKRELQMVQLSATRCSYITIL